MTGRWWQTRLGFQFADRLHAEPVEQVTPAAVMFNNRDATQGGGLCLPCAHLFVPLCLERVEACLVVGGIVTVELLQVLRRYSRHSQHPAWVEVDMWIACGMDIAVGAIQLCRCIQ